MLAASEVRLDGLDGGQYEWIIGGEWEGKREGEGSGGREDQGIRGCGIEFDGRRKRRTGGSRGECFDGWVCYLFSLLCLSELMLFFLPSSFHLSLVPSASSSVLTSVPPPPASVSKPFHCSPALFGGASSAVSLFLLPSSSTSDRSSSSSHPPALRFIAFSNRGGYTTCTFAVTLEANEPQVRVKGEVKHAEIEGVRATEVAFFPLEGGEGLLRAVVWDRASSAVHLLDLPSPSSVRSFPSSFQPLSSDPPSFVHSLPRRHHYSPLSLLHQHQLRRPPSSSFLPPSSSSVFRTDQSPSSSSPQHQKADVSKKLSSLARYTATASLTCRFCRRVGVDGRSRRRGRTG